jgi:phosphomevalonate kinase
MNPGRTTLRGSPLVVAPGKVFLCGEYAVLEEGVAVLAAVSRHAIGQYLPGGEPESPLVAETDRRARAVLGDLAAALPPGSVLVDTSAFAADGTKLGLGSSAAAAVATAGAIFEHAGVAVAGHEQLLYSVAEAGHRAAQGGVGSGADVAVAVEGGFIEFVRPHDGAPAVVRLAPPAALEMVVFWTRKAASTTDLVRAVRAFAARDEAAYQGLLAELRGTGDRFAKAFASNDERGVIAAADAYGLVMAALGEGADVPIVTPTLAAAAKLARTLGGAAKPAGAGGGDVGVGFFADAEAAAEFGRRCSSEVLVLDIRLGTAGAHRRVPTHIEMFKKD